MTQTTIQGRKFNVIASIEVTSALAPDFARIDIVEGPRKATYIRYERRNGSWFAMSGTGRIIEEGYPA